MSTSKRKGMDEFIKFNNQTAGRDKVFRLIQYLSRLVWRSMERNGAGKDSVARVKRIDDSLAVMRRLLRFGRFFETLHSALPLFSSVSNPIVRFTSAMSRISGGCYLFIDHIVCLDKLGVIALSKGKSANLDKLSSRFWLYAILLAIIRDLYEFVRIYREEYRTRVHLKKQRSAPAALNETEGSALLNESAEMEAEVAKTIAKQKQGYTGRIQTHCRQLNGISQTVSDHADVFIDTTKNVCDLFLPLSSLGYVKLNPTLMSCFGLLSTVLSAVPMFNPMLKMVPAS